MSYIVDSENICTLSFQRARGTLKKSAETPKQYAEIPYQKHPKQKPPTSRLVQGQVYNYGFYYNLRHIRHKLGSLCYNSRLCDTKIEPQHIRND